MGSPHGQPKQTKPYIFSSRGGGLAARPRLHFYPFPGGAHSGAFVKLFPARGAVLLGRVRFRRSAFCPPAPFESFIGGRGGRPPPPTLPLPAGVSPPGPLIVYRLLAGCPPTITVRSSFQALTTTRPPLVADRAQGPRPVSDNAALCCGGAADITDIIGHAPSWYDAGGIERIYCTVLAFRRGKAQGGPA